MTGDPPLSAAAALGAVGPGGAVGAGGVVGRGRHGDRASWPKARAIAGSAAAPLPRETVALGRAVGRRLAADVHARVDLPSTDLSAMDGWAVAGPPPWRVVADLPAGSTGAPALRDGECARIATGASVPPGAVAVLPVEQSSVAAEGVRPRCGWPLPRRHVRSAGEEARRGELLVPAGRRVTPPVVGLAAAGGHDALVVAGRTTVDVLVLGDELCTAGLPAPGRTRDALGPQLPGWLHGLGAHPRSVDRLPDLLPALVAALAVADADLLLTTGGTSVGPRDHVRAAVAEVGGRLLVDGVDVKPGHPMLLAALPQGRWLVGLPGNPLAACVALMTVVAPLLCRLHDEPLPALTTVTLATDQPGRDGDGHRLLPVRPAGGDQPERRRDHRPRRPDLVEVLPACGSAMLRGLASATGLAVVGPSGARAGERVSCLPLPW